MNRNSNNDKANKEVDRQKRIEEGQVLEKYFRLIRYRLENSETIQNMASMDYNKQTDYAAERRVLMKVNQLGLFEGMLAGAVTFITLRRAPTLITKWLVRRNQARGYKLDQPHPFASSDQKPSRALLPLRVLRFGLDVAVSLVVAASTSLYFTDQKKMMEQISNVPLVEGRSTVSDVFCPDMIQEFQKHPPEFWNNTQSLPMQSIKTFVTNCRLRAAHEDRLREEQGLTRNEPVKIPPPGVDTSLDAKAFDEFSFDTSESDSFGSSSGGDPLFGDAGSGEYFGGQDPKNDGGWADSMTTDQEKDGKGRGF